MEFDSVQAAIDAARAGEPLEADDEGAAAALAWGLIGPEGEITPAAQQYLDVRGDIDDDALVFLPHVFTDLHARLAVLDGGTLLVDEFRAALLAGRGVEHCRELVPPAFAAVVDDRMAIDLFAACVALMARLSAGVAAACVAEEIVAVELLRNAAAILEARPGGGAAAAEELYGIFDLFGDDDVLRMFEFKEPGDAAVAGHSESDAELGVVDQRPEAWFVPFGLVPLTGHLGEGPEGSS